MKYENQLEFVREKLAAMRTTEWKAVSEAAGVPYGTVYNIAYARRSKSPSYDNVYALYTHLKATRKPYAVRIAREVSRPRDPQYA